MKEHIEEVLKNIEDIKSIRNSLNYEERNYLASNLDDFNLYDLKPKDLMNLYKNIYSLEEAKAKIESTNDIMDYTRLFAIICLPDSLKESYINLYDDINVKCLFISTFDADELKLKYLKTGKYDDYASDIIPSMTNDSLKMEYINSLEDKDKKADLVTYLESDTLKEEFLSNNSLNNNASYSITQSIKDEDIFLQCLRFNSDEKKKKLLIYRKNPHTQAIGLQYINDDVIRNQTSHDIAKNIQIINLDDYDFFDDADKRRIFCRTMDSTKKLSDDFILKLAPKIKDIGEKNLVLRRLKSDEIKKTMLPEFQYDVFFINDIKDEKIRYSCLSKMPSNFDRYYTINNFKNEELKVLALQFLDNNEYRMDIVCSLTDDNLKIQSLAFFKDEEYRATIIRSITDDKLKLKQLENIEYLENRLKIIRAITNDELKMQYLQENSLDDYFRLEVIRTLKDENKFSYINKEQSEEINYEIIMLMKSDELKIRGLQFIETPGLRLNIITSLKDENKIPFFSNISSDDANLDIWKSLYNAQNKLKYMHLINTNAISRNFLIDNFLEVSEFGVTNALIEFIKPKDESVTRKLKIIGDFITKIDYESLKVRLYKYIVSIIDADNLEEILANMEKTLKVFKAFDCTNSLELYNMRNRFVETLIFSDDPGIIFNKIESVFLKNNIPTFAKIFLCFGYLYPDLKNININENCTSPEIVNPTQTRRMEVTSRNASVNTKRMQIFLNDLIRIGTHSGNRSLIRYLDNIENGDKLFNALEKKIVSYDSLPLEAKEVLKIYENHLESLYSYLKRKDDLDISSLSNLEKINYLAHKFYGNDDLALIISNSRYSLPDRIIRSFAYQAGFDTFAEFKRVVINTKKDKEKVSINRSKELENSTLQLEKGDLIRGIGNIYSIESILKDGNVCKEFLGTLVGSSESDATPLDIDLSLIMEDGKNVSENIGSSTTSNYYGNIYFVIKKDNLGINLTRNSDGTLTGNAYDPGKMELFRTLSERHFGIRTGIAAADIDYIIYRKDMENSNDLNILKNEIAKNGLYIPVVDMDGKLVFTYEEYESLKGKMKGLSFYGNKEYNLSNYSTSSYVNRLNALVEKNREDVLKKSNLVYQALASAINQINLDGKNLKTVIGLDTELTKGNVEVLETGSSARGTNVPSDYDFDYIFRLDADIMRDSSKLTNFKIRFCEALGIPPITGDLRDMSVDIPGLGEIKLDVTIIQKNDKLEYSTEMALNDYLTTIGNNNQNVRDVITANVILAKLLFKNAGCYKNRRKDSNQGGLGGVGVENWIIQNGGTLESAAKSFLENAEGKTFEEFKKVYHVHDYGKNHMYRDKNLYPYDDFVYNNMNATGYEKMKTILNKYLQYLKGDNLALPEMDKIIEELENKMLLETNKSIKTSHI